MPGSTSGAIFYDRKDIQTLDLGSLRKLIGTVLQEGELFSGSIFENITISAPNLTLQKPCARGGTYLVAKNRTMV